MMIKKLFITSFLICSLVTSASAAFLKTEYLDQFNRADENLDVSASWTQITNADDLKVISNVVGCTATAPYGYAGDYWDDATYQDTDASMVISTLPAAGTPIILTARATTTDLLTVDGYCVQYIVVAGASNDQLILSRLDNGAATTLGSVRTGDLSPGVIIGITTVGNTITGWYNTGGDSIAFTQATDATYPNAGYIAVVATDTTVRVDDLRGGAARNRQIIMAQ